jgi:UDP-glucose 4-epimerase
MKTIVTGGAGFIGSNLAEELVRKGSDVVILDDLSTGKEGNIKEFKDSVRFVKGSITDLALLKELFRDVECVFHQAAIPSVQPSIEDPIRTNEVNVKGTLNVLVAARDSEVEKVVYASSSSVYGDSWAPPTSPQAPKGLTELPKREEMKPKPKSPYAVSKLTGEGYCAVFSEVYGLKTVSLRYFNVYGPRQDPYSDYAAVIPRFITRGLKNKPPLIYGDGNQTRDFTFVKDAVKANILAMENNVEGIFNIASGKRISINELANKIMGIVGIRLKPIYDTPREGDIKDSLGDISRAKEKLGYEPKYNLEEGLKETIEYFKVMLIKGRDKKGRSLQG